MPNWIDTVFLVFLVVVVLKTFRNGTFRAILEIVLFFVSIYIAEKICQSLIFNAKLFEASNTLAYAVFFVFFFVAIYFILKVVLWFSSRLIKVEVLGTFDKALAAGVGILIAFLNVGLLMNIATMAPFSQNAKTYIEASYAFKYGTPVFNKMYELAFTFAPKMDKLIGKNIEDTIEEKSKAGEAAIIDLKIPELLSEEKIKAYTDGLEEADKAKTFLEERRVKRNKLLK